MDETTDYREAEAILRQLAAASAATGQKPPQTTTRSSSLPKYPVDADAGDGGLPSEVTGQLRRAEARYRALVEQIPAVTFMASLDEDVSELFVSSHIESLLGFTQQEWLSDPFLWYRQLHPDDRIRWQDEFGRTCATGVDFRADYRFLARNGNTVWVRGEAAIVRDVDGQPLFLQGIAFDITEIKEAELQLKTVNETLERQVARRTAELSEANVQLRQARDELEMRVEQRTLALQKSNDELARSNQELDDFAYIASHDLREPLRGIQNYSTFLLEDYGDLVDDEGRQKLHTLIRLSRRLDTLIDALLTFSRVGRLELAIGETDLNQVLEEAADLLRVSLEERGVQLRIPRPLPTILCDRVRVTELFRNLISNAIKYNDKADKWIEVGMCDASAPRRDPNSTDRPDRQSATHVFYVRDNGIGIRVKHFETIFQIFKRLHARDKFGGGTGSGLTIVKKIVERHGGAVWVESVDGEGSSFYFSLPAADKPHIDQSQNPGEVQDERDRI